MIRKMEFEDIPWCSTNVQMLADNIGLEIEVSNNINYLHSLFGKCWESGNSWFVEEDGERKAHILSMKVPDLWNPSKTLLTSISVHRHGASPYQMGKLLHHFTKMAQEDEGVDVITLTSNSCSNSIDYSKLNYTPAERVYTLNGG